MPRPQTVSQTVPPPPSPTRSRVAREAPFGLKLETAGHFGGWKLSIVFNFGLNSRRLPTAEVPPESTLYSRKLHGATPLLKPLGKFLLHSSTPLVWRIKEAEGEMVEMFIGAGHSAATQSVPVYFGMSRPNLRRTSSGTNLPTTKWWRPEKRLAQLLGAAKDTSTSGCTSSFASPPASVSQPEGGRGGAGRTEAPRQGLPCLPPGSVPQPPARG